MNWNELVRKALVDVAGFKSEEVEDDQLSLFDDLRLSSLQLTALMRKLDRSTGRAIPIDQWFTEQLTTGEGTIGSLVSWLSASVGTTDA